MSDLRNESWIVEGPSGLACVIDAEGDTVAMLSGPQYLLGARARLMASAPKLLDALLITRGNILSLGPAGALESVPMPYREWLRVVDEALLAAGHWSGWEE